jgi:hypothetical protein
MCFKKALLLFQVLGISLQAQSPLPQIKKWLDDSSYLETRIEDMK